MPDFINPLRRGYTPPAYSYATTGFTFKTIVLSKGCLGYFL